MGLLTIAPAVQAPRAYTRVFVLRLPLTTLMFELENTMPCTRNAELLLGCWMFNPSSPGTRPSVRIALPGRLHWLSDGHWISTRCGSVMHFTAAVSAPNGTWSVFPPVKQVLPAAPL